MRACVCVMRCVSEFVGGIVLTYNILLRARDLTAGLIGKAEHRLDSMRLMGLSLCECVCVFVFVRVFVCRCVFV